MADYSRESDLRQLVALTPGEEAHAFVQNHSDSNLAELRGEIQRNRNNPMQRAILEQEYQRLTGGAPQADAGQGGSPLDSFLDAGKGRSGGARAQRASLDDFLDNLPAPQADAPAKSGGLRRAADVGLSLLKGAVGVPESAVGMADLATGGRVGKFLENEGGAIGFRPKEARAYLDTLYSPEQQAANAEVQNAHGIVDTAAAALRNPSVIAHSAIESLPAMGAGGVVGRGMMALAPRMGAAVAAGAGEGVVAAGQQAEQVRQQTPDGLLTGQQAALAAGSGLATGAIGVGAGRLAQRLGLENAETLLVSGKATSVQKKNLTRRVLGGFVTEGILEELPQSVQEQVAQNMALGKPLDEGVDQAAVLGVLTGGAMGVGAQAFHRSAEAAPAAETAPAPAAGAPVEFDQAGAAAALDAARQPPTPTTGAPAAPGNGIDFQADPRFENAPTWLNGAAPASQVYGTQQAASIALGEQGLLGSHRVVPGPDGGFVIEPTGGPGMTTVAPGVYETPPPAGDALRAQLQPGGGPLATAVNAGIEAQAQRVDAGLAPAETRSAEDVQAEQQQIEAQQADQQAQQQKAADRAVAEQQKAADQAAKEQESARTKAAAEAEATAKKEADAHRAISLKAAPDEAFTDRQEQSVLDALQHDDYDRTPVPLVEHGFTGTQIESLQRAGLADADGAMSPSQFQTWSKERDQRAKVAEQEAAKAEKAKASPPAPAPAPAPRPAAAPAPAAVAPTPTTKAAAIAQREATRPKEPTETMQPGDIGSKATGEPFKLPAGAQRALKLAGPGHELVAVKGGQVVRKTAPALSKIAGKPIDDEWTAFHPDSGTKAIPRADMPQIKAEHRGAMTQFLLARGIAHEQTEMPAADLKPTQAEFSPAKVLKAKAFEGGDRSILVSSDGHVLDGHHQWLAKRESGDPVKVIKLDAPIAKLVDEVKQFPSAAVAGGAQSATATLRPLDHGELNIPGRTNGINAELDRFKAEQAKADAAAARKVTDQKRADKAEAKALSDKHLDGIVAHTAPGIAKRQGMAAKLAERQVRDTVDQMVKWEPRKAIDLFNKYLKETGKNEPSQPATKAPAAAPVEARGDQPAAGGAAGRPAADVPAARAAAVEPAGLTDQAKDASGNVIQRPKLTGGDRFEKPSNGDAVTEAAMGRVVDYMNGEIDRPTLMQHLEDSGLAQGTVIAITQRLQSDGPSMGEVDRMLASREKRGIATRGMEGENWWKSMAPAGRAEALKAAGVRGVTSATTWDYLSYNDQKKLDAVRRTTAAPVIKDSAESPAPAPVRKQSGIADEATPFSRAPVPAGGQPVEVVQAQVDRITAKWTNAPPVVVARNMDDPIIPAVARRHDSARSSQGAAGVTDGFYRDGTVYLLADRLGGPADVVRVLFHEALGHHGLRGIYGSSIGTILVRIAAQQPGKVQAKADEYKLDMSVLEQRRLAAEEVLAEMAETSPELGWVKNLIAAVRSWLRSRVPGFANLRLADAEIVRDYITPARLYVQRGIAFADTVPAVHSPSDLTAFSLGGALANSMNNVAAVKLPAGYVVGDLLNKDGKLSWWHKTVGTMHNLAERSPEFKRVYDATQRFLGDVSAYATEAADLAPRMLPKLENWRDIAKSPLSAADTKAISAPIFEGTLTWARDAGGKPVKVVDPSPSDGVVWTDDELRDMFKLTPKQIELYREFRAATDKSLTSLGVSDMLRFAGKDADAVRDKALATATATDAADIISKHLQAQAAANPGRAAVLVDTASTVLDKAAKIQGLIEHGYAPLSRFGQHTLDVTDVNGARVYFGMFEGTAERAKMARQMVAQFPGAKVSMGTVSQEAHKLFAGVSPETLELFGEMLGLESTGDAAKDQAFQEYLRLAASTRSAMKRLIHRKGIAGFSEDAGRVLAGFVYSNARRTSSNLHAGEMTAAANDIPKEKGELKDAAVKLLDYVRNPREEAQALRGLLFAQYLGGSVASAMVNATQPFVTTFPWLSQYGGAVKAGQRMAAALKDAASRRGTGDKALDAALKHAEEQGIVAPQEVHQLMAQANGSAVLKSGDGTTSGAVAAGASNVLAKVSLAWGKVFGVAEQFNRRTTFIAAYRTAVDEGLGDPTAFAAKAVAETQFTANKGSKPNWARGAVGGTLFTFKNYSISYLELLSRMWTQGGADGKKATLLALGVLFLLSGADGLPFEADAEDVIDGFMQRLGYNFNSSAAKERFFADVFGADFGRFIQKGASGLPGVPIDVSGRLGMGNMLPGTGLLTKRTDHTSDLAEIAGPAGDLVKRAAQAGGQLVSGDVAGAASTISPTAVRNLAKAFDMADTGMYRDSHGRKVIDVDGYDTVAKAIGFQPNAVARVQDAARQVQLAVQQAQMRKTEISDAWAQALFERNPAKVQAARESLAQWNADNPESKITINLPSVLRRVKTMNESKAERVAKTAPKEVRNEVRRQVSESAL